jgi:hypothetical protein
MFVMVMGCVLFEVRPGFLNIIQTIFGFKGLIVFSHFASDMGLREFAKSNATGT